MKTIFVAVLFLGMNVFANMDCSKLVSEESNYYYSLSRNGFGPLLSLGFRPTGTVTMCVTDYCIPGPHTFKCDSKEGLVEIYNGNKKIKSGYYNSDSDVLIMESSMSSTPSMLWMKRSN